MGKYYPCAHSQSDRESFAISFLNCIRNTVSFTGVHVRFSRFQPRSNDVGWFNAQAGEFTRGIPNSSQTEAVNAPYCSGAL